MPFDNAWSSSRRNDNNAWIWNSNGYTNNNNFNNGYAVRGFAN